MLETMGGGLVNDVVVNKHHTSKNSSSGGWNGGGGGEQRSNQHISGPPLDKNVDDNMHLNASRSDGVSHHPSMPDIGSIKDGRSGVAVASVGESGSGGAHNVNNLTDVGNRGHPAISNSNGGAGGGGGGGSSRPSSSDSVAENAITETAFTGFGCGFEANCSEQGHIGNMVDSGLSSSYKRSNSAPQVSNYVFNWRQSKLDSTSLSEHKGVSGGDVSAEVGGSTAESIHTDYYSYDHGPQSIHHYSSAPHGHTHSAHQLETDREMIQKELGHPGLSFSSQDQQHLSAVGGITAGYGPAFASESRSNTSVGLESLYRGGDQDMQGRSEGFGPGGRYRDTEGGHRRAITLIPGAMLECSLPNPQGDGPATGSPDFLTDIMLPSEFPTDGGERESYIVSPSAVPAEIHVQGFARPMQRQASPCPLGNHRPTTLPRPRSSHNVLDCIASDGASERQGYTPPPSSHKPLNGDVYDDTLGSRRGRSYGGGPGNATGGMGGVAQQGQQEVMDLNSAFTGLGLSSKPSKSHVTIPKGRSFSGFPIAHQHDGALNSNFRSAHYTNYSPSEYRADLRSHVQHGGRLGMEPFTMTEQQVDLKVAERQVAQQSANAYCIDHRGPGMYVDPLFQCRPMPSHPYAEPPLCSQEVDHSRLRDGDIVPMVHNPPAHHLAYYPLDPRSAMSAPPGDPMYHGKAYTPSDDFGYEVRQGGGGGARVKPYKERRGDRDREVRDVPRERQQRIGSNTSRSCLLEDFLINSNSKSHRWSLSDIQGQVVQFCHDQHGSRFIQQKLEAATVEEKVMFFQEILPHVPSLNTDVFGNYVVQKLFDHGTTTQQEALAGFLVGHAVELSLQMYGCRVVQKALEFASLDTLILLVNEFRGHVLKCVQDQNGNHVIQKCIQVMSKVADEEGMHLHEHVQFIIDAFVNQVQKLSTHAYGCRVIQRILEYCVDSQRDVIVAEIRASFSRLIRNQYGNYVIQHVLKHGKPKDRKILLEDVQKNLLTYSQHKFASNVVEKCLEFGTVEERGIIIDDVFNEHILLRDGQRNLLQAMVCDPYANYVVQKMLDVATPEQHAAIVTEIKAHSSQLKRFTFGKYIISRLEKISSNGEEWSRD